MQTGRERQSRSLPVQSRIVGGAGRPYHFQMKGVTKLWVVVLHGLFSQSYIELLDANVGAAIHRLAT